MLLLSFLAGGAHGYSLQLTDEEQQWLARNPVIRFGFSDSLVPYGILKQDGTSAGIAADHLDLLASRLGITITLELAPWPIALERVKNRQVDGIAAILPAHGKTYDLDTTIPLRFNSTPTAYTLENSSLDIKTVDDFTGARVVIIKGMLYAQNFLAPVGDAITVTEVNSSEEAFALLLNKEADIFLGLNLDHYTITHRFIVGVKPARIFWDATFFVYMGVRNDQPLLVSILKKANKSLTNAEIFAIHRRWLEIPMEKTSPIFTPTEQKFMIDHPDIQLGVDLNYAPFESMDKKKGHQGMSKNYLHLISGHTKFQFHPHPSWDNALLHRQMQTKKIDMLSLHVKDVTAPHDQYLYSNPILKVPVAILARLGTDFIATIEHIREHRIGVVQGHPPELLVLNKYPQATLIRYTTLTDGLQGLAKGSCDFFIETLPQANHIIHSKGITGIGPVGKMEQEFSFCFAIHKDLPELHSIINKVLDAIPLEQKLQIQQKRTNLPVPPKHNWKPVVNISIMALILIAIMVIWNRRLHREIKARKKAESSLQLAKLTLDSIPLHIFWFDQDFRVAMANRAAADRSGFSHAELLGKTAWDLDPSFDINNRHRSWAEVKENKSSRYFGQLQFKNGDIIPTEESLTYLQNAAGESFIVSIGFDITERNLRAQQLKESERKLKEALGKAKESSRLKSEFLSNMSHEIRTPLNAIIGYSEMLSQGDLPTNKQRYAQTIIKSGKTLITLINDILDLSKMEAGKMQICPIAINPHVFFAEITKFFEPQLLEKQLELQISIDQNLPQVLMLDEVRLRQVLFNILGNGIKFTEQGYIKLAANYAKTSPTLGTLTITISDSGIGIAKEDHESIFQSFQQQSGGTNRTYGGTGLGLTLSKRFIELMQGEIQLESTPGHGSCFKLILPGVPISGGTKPNETPPPQNGAQFPTATVLIADDIKTNRDLITAFLQDTPLTLLTATNGEEAMQIAQNQHPDLILMDIKMDIMSGTEAAIILKGEPATASIPIIALSGLDPEPEHLDVFDDFVHKPFSLQIIHQKMSQYLPGPKPEFGDNLGHKLEQSPPFPLSLEEKNKLRQLISEANKTGRLAANQHIADKLQQYGDKYENDTMKQIGQKLSEHCKQGAIIEIEHLLFLLQQHLQEQVS